MMAVGLLPGLCAADCCFWADGLGAAVSGWVRIGSELVQVLSDSHKSIFFLPEEAASAPGPSLRDQGLSGAKTKTIRQSFFVNTFWHLYSSDQLCNSTQVNLFSA
jgi:hypothetical protein